MESVQSVDDKKVMNLELGVRANHPRWTREELFEEGMGLAFFGNGMQYI
jgi:hypothetical protein